MSTSKVDLRGQIDKMTYSIVGLSIKWYNTSITYYLCIHSMINQENSSHYPKQPNKHYVRNCALVALSLVGYLYGTNVKPLSAQTIKPPQTTPIPPSEGWKALNICDPKYQEEIFPYSEFISEYSKRIAGEEPNSGVPVALYNEKIRTADDIVSYLNTQKNPFDGLSTLKEGKNPYSIVFAGMDSISTQIAKKLKDKLVSSFLKEKLPITVSFLNRTPPFYLSVNKDAFINYNPDQTDSFLEQAENNNKSADSLVLFANSPQNAGTSEGSTIIIASKDIVFAEIALWEEMAHLLLRYRERYPVYLEYNSEYPEEFLSELGFYPRFMQSTKKGCYLTTDRLVYDVLIKNPELRKKILSSLEQIGICQIPGIINTKIFRSIANDFGNTGKFTPLDTGLAIDYLKFIEYMKKLGPNDEFIPPESPKEREICPRTKGRRLKRKLNPTDEKKGLELTSKNPKNFLD